MDIERFTATPQVQKLSARQRLFVLSYVQSGDRVFATRAAYAASNLESQRILGYRILASEPVKAALRVWRDGVFLEALRAEIAISAAGKRKTLLKKFYTLLEKIK